jgi:hypothetical protein
MPRIHVRLNIPLVKKNGVKSGNLKGTALSEFGDDLTGKYLNIHFFKLLRAKHGVNL